MKIDLPIQAPEGVDFPPYLRNYVDSGGLLGDDARDGRRATQGLEPGCQ